MKTPNRDVDSFIEALRGDLPSADDEARVRARLLCAGVVVGGTTVASSSGAASLAGSTSGVAASSAGVGAGGLGAGLASGGMGAAGAPVVLAKAGLLSKIVVLPVAAKLGVATTLAVAVAATSVPLLSRDEPMANGPAPTSSALAMARAPSAPNTIASGAASNATSSVSASSDTDSNRTGSDSMDSNSMDSNSIDSNAPASGADRSGGAVAAASASSTTRAQPAAASEPSDLTAQRRGRGGVASDEARPREGSLSAMAPGRSRPSERAGRSTQRERTETSSARERGAANTDEPSRASRSQPAAGLTAPANAVTLEGGRTELVRASSRLAEETRLIEQALVALGDGDSSLARLSLDEHARRFPDGLLARERERARARLHELDARGR